MDFALNSPTVMGKIAELTPLLPQVIFHQVYSVHLYSTFNLLGANKRTAWDIPDNCGEGVNRDFSPYALLPRGSPFGEPGPHGDLFQFLGPQKVPIVGHCATFCVVQ